MICTLVKAAMAELVTQGTRLEALGASLVEAAALRGAAGADELVHAAAKIRAIAMAALDGATSALLVAERLDTLATIKGDEQ